MTLEKMYEWCVAAMEAELNGKPLELSPKSRRELRSAGRKALGRLLKRKEARLVKEARLAKEAADIAAATDEDALIYDLSEAQLALVNRGMEITFGISIHRDAQGHLWLWVLGENDARAVIPRSRRLNRVWGMAAIIHDHTPRSLH